MEIAGNELNVNYCYIIIGGAALISDREMILQSIILILNCLLSDKKCYMH